MVRTLFASLTITALAGCMAAGQPPPRGPGVEAAPAPAAPGSHRPARPTFTALNDTCALASDGRLFCFGLADSGAETTPDEVNHAHAVAGVTDASMFDGRSNVCYAHRSAPARVSCLVRSHPGAPLEPADTYDLPEKIRELSGNCAVTTSGSVYCWGPTSSHAFLTGEAFGTTGGETVKVLGPTKLPLPPVRGFARSLGGLCVATEDGRIGCWGLYNVLAERAGLRKKTAARTDEVTWLDAPKGTVDAFVVGVHTDYFESYKNPFCFQATDGSFTCEDQRETKDLARWLNEHAIRRVTPLGDGVVGLSADGTLRAFHLHERPQFEILSILGDRAIPDVVAFGAHVGHACTLDRGGDVACFGVRDDGWLGNGERLSSPKPLPVAVPAAVQLTSSGASQFCTRTQSGRVHCWGGFDFPGYLARRSITEIALPEPAAGIVGGETLCAQGSANWWCTSPAIRPARADGFTRLDDPSGRPVPLDAKLDIDSGIGLFFATPKNQRGVFWYSSNPKPLVTARYGAKGERALPATDRCIEKASGTRACGELAGFVYLVDVPAGSEPRKLLASRLEVAMLTMKGDLYFGTRADHGPVQWESTPRETGIRDAVSVRNPDQRAASSICVLRETGEVLCRGHNRYGELGDGTYAPHADFRRVEGLAKIGSIAGGSQSMCALDDAGHVSCWGGDSSGALGQGSKRYVEMPHPIVIE